jgi:hypothetical protein
MMGTVTAAALGMLAGAVIHATGRTVKMGGVMIESWAVAICGMVGETSMVMITGVVARQGAMAAGVSPRSWSKATKLVPLVAGTPCLLTMSSYCGDQPLTRTPFSDRGIQCWTSWLRPVLFRRMERPWAHACKRLWTCPLLGRCMLKRYSF